MKKAITFFLLVGFVFILLSPFYSFAEERITLTTYYPAPYGIYKEMRADQMAVGSAYRYVPLSDGILIVSGSIGVGTTEPVVPLTVNGAAKIGSVYIGDVVADAGGGRGQNKGQIWYDSSGQLHLYAYEKGGISFHAANAGTGDAPTTEMVITNIGNVGIGTTPFQGDKLSVAGRIYSGNPAVPQNEGIYLGYETNPNTGFLTSYKDLGSGQGEGRGLVINSYGGSVGIGVNPPDNKDRLVVASPPLKGTSDNAYARLRVWARDVNKSVYLGYSGTSDVGFLTSYDDNFSPDYPDGRYKNLVINAYGGNDGNVGIGTPAPTAKLDVNGDVNIRGDLKVSQRNQNYVYSGGAHGIGWNQAIGPTDNANFNRVGDGKFMCPDKQYVCGIANVLNDCDKNEGNCFVVIPVCCN